MRDILQFAKFIHQINNAFDPSLGKSRGTCRLLKFFYDINGVIRVSTRQMNCSTPLSPVFSQNLDARNDRSVDGVKISPVRKKRKLL